MKKEDIILVGGGGHCKACIDVIEEEGTFNIAGIVDLSEKVGEEVFGYKIIATDDELSELANSYNNFLITAGQIKNPNLRIKLFNKLKNLEVNFPVIISPNSYVSRHAKIGKGTIVMHNAVINADASVGMNSIVNNKALIEHDAQVGNHCHISTGAIVNGGVKVGEETFFGSGAVSKQYIEIPPRSFIKANSIVK